MARIPEWERIPAELMWGRRKRNHEWADGLAGVPRCESGGFGCILSDTMRIQLSVYFAVIGSICMSVPVFAGQPLRAMSAQQQPAQQASSPKPEDTEVWQPEPKVV